MRLNFFTYGVALDVTENNFHFCLQLGDSKRRHLFRCVKDAIPYFNFYCMRFALRFDLRGLIVSVNGHRFWVVKVPQGVVKAIFLQEYRITRKETRRMLFQGKEE